MVGQYHLYNAFGDLRTWAAWHNGLDANERAFVQFYRQVNQPGALDWADVRRVPPNETLGVKLGIDPEMGERLSRAFSVASASMGASAGAYAEYGQSIARVAKVNAYPFAKVNTPGMGTYIGATKEAKPIDSARARKVFVREAFRLRLKHHPVFGIRLPRMVRDIAARYIPMSFISFWERFP